MTTFCGSWLGWNGHRRRGEKPCQACKLGVLIDWSPRKPGKGAGRIRKADIDPVVVEILVIGRRHVDANEHERIAAMGILLARQYERVTIVEIAQRCGLSAKTVERYSARLGGLRNAG